MGPADHDRLRVQLVDPSAYTPPYDRALAQSLAAAGAEVELVTSSFLYAPVPPPEGYTVTEHFYRHGPRRAGSRGRRLAKAVQHPIDMRRLRRGRGLRIPRPDIRHFQWAPVPHYDAGALARFDSPVVLTAHDVLPREPAPGQLDAQRRLYERVDAVVVHSRHGAARLKAEAGVPESKISVIPHGAFTHLTEQADPAAMPADLSRWIGDGPVALFFGLLRPYKGIEVLMRAWREVSDPAARLLIVGLPKMPLDPLLADADDRVRFVDRFVYDGEIPAFFERADLIVLPYTEIDQSGVLYTALAFGKACVLTGVGGFTEVAAEHGFGRLVEPGDAGELAAAMKALLSDDAERRRLESAARLAAAGPFSWSTIASMHLGLYRDLLGR